MEATRESELAALANKYELEISKKRRKNLMEVDQTAFESYKAGIEIAYACKNMDLEGGFNTYRYCKDHNVPLSHNLYTNLLSLTAGLGDPGCGSLMRRAAPPKDYQKAMEIYSTIKELKIVPAEAAFSALIRCCCTEGYRDQALLLYEDMKKVGLEAKLRGITPLITAFGAVGDTDTCFYLFDEMKARWNIEPMEKEYYGLLQACSIKQDARFMSIVDEMMEDLMVLHNQETLDLLTQHLCKADYGFQHISSSVNTEGVLLNLDADCNIHAQLQSIDLNVDTRAGLLDQLQSFAIDRDPAQKHKLNNKVKDYVSVATPVAPPTEQSPSEQPTAEATAVSTSETPTVPVPSQPRKTLHLPKANEEKWSAFTSWLAHKHATQPFDIIVDGANVGYYKQNFPGAPPHIDYHQLHALLESLIHEHRRQPLLIIHSRHLGEHMIPATHKDAQVIREMIASWRARNLIYATPKGFNDDWFWLYATVKYQVPVVTNDEMRDHHFKLLAPRYFLRWRERSRVCYDLFFKKSKALQASSAVDGHGEEDQDEEEEVDYDSDVIPLNTNDNSGTTMSSFSFKANIKQKFSPHVHRSHAKLYFPRKYSYRMQHWTLSNGANATVELLCFPPLAPKYDNNLVDPDVPKPSSAEDNTNNNTNNSNNNNNNRKSNNPNDVVGDARLPWLVLYKTVSA